MPYQSQDVRRKRRRRRRRKRLRPQFLALVAIAVVLLVGLIFGISKLTDTKTEKPEAAAPKEETGFFAKLFGSKKEEEPTEPEPTQPEPVHEVSKATIAAVGDILMHKPVFNAGLQSDGSYNLEFIFQYAKPFISDADFAAANLETTLCGTDNGYPYNGYPNFNSPDEIVDAAKNAGFDMLLTANNHCYDTGSVGYQRTISTVRGKGLQNLGTMATENDPKYVIQNINGIKVGMLCYTYEQPPAEAQPDRVYLNGIPMVAGGDKLINSFLPENPEPFYKEIGQYLDEMRAKGADATVLFIHWGIEYQTTPNGDQRMMAQRLADLGVDVIVGGHPHVVQPLDMVTSRTDPNHKTIVLYSMGNTVSNQRKEEMDLKTGHTEDGVLMTFTFTKYSDNSVYLEDVDLLPTWVYLRRSSSTEYDVLPLTDSTRTSWRADYSLDDNAYNDAVNSYDRTYDIIHDGLTRAQDYLAAQKEQRIADYLAEAAPLDEAA